MVNAYDLQLKELYQLSEDNFKDYAKARATREFLKSLINQRENELMVSLKMAEISKYNFVLDDLKPIHRDIIMDYFNNPDQTQQAIAIKHNVSASDVSHIIKEFFEIIKVKKD
jgi:DNA-directed RNA polymerase specialized sigma subunit